MYEVIYFSRGGNTRKMAAAIADELGIKAHPVRLVKNLPGGADIFLGSGLYFLRPSKLVREFIQNNDFRGRKVALFGSSTTGIGIETMGMERLLISKGAIITGKFHCGGSFFFMRQGQPSEKDLGKARQFARTIKNSNLNANPAGKKVKELNWISKSL